jgi:DNA-binding NarL/FixJ family response regulator
MKFLIAEDEKETRLLLSEIYLSHTVLQAKNGEELLYLYRREKPDLIITDLDMPGMTGDQAIREIRYSDKKTPIVVVSNYDREEELKGYIQLYVKKTELSGFSRKISELIVRPDFTKRQKEIFVLLKEGKTSAEIAEQLFISQRTVENHRQAIRNLLGIENRKSLLSINI